MDIRTREAVRYLGYGGHAIDERTLQLVQDSFEELNAYVDARFVYRIFEISKADEHGLVIGNLEIASKDLAKNLKGCKQAVFFGTTLGAGVDMLMKRHSVSDMAKTAVIQACAAAMLEEYCDKIEKQIATEYGSKVYLRPRFSPGYGDFSIFYQKDLLDILEASKKIGLTMTDGYMLTPTKSVTAVIGLSEEERC